MEIKHVTGKRNRNIMLYALSTCVWCKKTKRMLNDLGVAYDYIDVDLLDSSAKEEVNKQVSHWNPSGSYPTIVVDESECIVGYDPDRIKELFQNER